MTLEFTKDLYQRSLNFGGKSSVPLRSGNTCEWFLDHPNVFQWRNSARPSVLWVTADAGYGKSVLANFLVGRFSDDNRVIHFFFEHPRYNKNSLLCALLLQLLKLVRSPEAKFNTMFHILCDELEYKKGEQIMQEDETLWKIICNATSGSQHNSSKLVCIIDGLDECPEPSRSQFINLIVTTFSSSGTARQPHQPPNFLITSRPYTVIEECFRPSSRIHLRLEDETSAISKDIETMIADRVQNLNSTRFSPKVLEYLHAEISRKAGRTFLWARLVMDALEQLDSVTYQEVRKLLDTNPDELDETYARILGPLDVPTSNNTRKLFQWMCFSLRPLTVCEMRHALGIDPDSHTSSTREAYSMGLHDLEEDSKLLVSTVSKGLATVISTSKLEDNSPNADTVSFIHDTARAFIMQRVFATASSRAAANFELALSSFCYIRLAGVQERLAGFYEARQIVGFMEEFPLLKYASEHCSTHARLASERGSNLESLMEIIAQGNDSIRQLSSEEFHSFEKDLDSAVRDAFIGPNPFLTESGILSTWFKASALWPSLRANFFWPNPGITVVHFLAKNDLFSLLSRANIPTDFDWDRQDQYGRTPLSWAAEYASLKTVELLLKRGANIWKRDLCGETPFSWSAWRGNVDIARVLLGEETHADINSHNLILQTPLCLAVQSEKVDMVSFLLKANSDIDFRDCNGRTPLSWAAEIGNVELVKLLLENGANPHTTDAQDRTPLSYTGNIVNDWQTKSKIQLVLQESVTQYRRLEKRSEKGTEIPVEDLSSHFRRQQRDSDSGSDISDVLSLWSAHASSKSSKTSIGFAQEDYKDATRRLADEFSRQNGMPELYGNALRLFGKERFAIYHGRLLKMLFQDLGSQATGQTEKYAVRIFRQKRKRDEVTGLIQDQVVQAIKSTEPAASGKARMNSYPMWRQINPGLHGRYLNDDHWRGELSLREDLEDPPGDAEVDVGGEEEEDDDEKEEEDDDEKEEEDDDEKEKEDVVEDEEKDRHPRHDSQELSSVRVMEHNVEEALAFLVGGNPFVRFRESFELLVNPSQTIEQALERQDSRGLRRLLRNNFRLVTEGDYRWLRELNAVGYSHDAIAQLLLEDVAEAPWIVFEPHEFVDSKPTVPFHHPGCAHHPMDGLLSRCAQPRTWTSELDVVNTVQELCGLGGILPISQDQNKWTGQCSFRKDDKSTALLTYNMSLNTKTNHRHLIFRILRILDNICTAAGHLQNTGLCCDSFTIVTTRECSAGFEELELVRIGFDMPVLLCEEIRKLKATTDLTSENVRPCASVAKRIIKLLHMPFVNSALPEAVAISDFLSSHDSHLTTQLPESYRQENLEGALHTCALAAQLLCVGLTSFLQAHVGCFEPFFLNTELKEILLLGNLLFPQEEQKFYFPIVRINLKELTCLSKMTGGAVLAFSVVGAQLEEISPQEETPRDLVCHIDELLETWGPGHCISSEEDRSKIKAIELGGGLIYAVDINGSKFHWEPKTSVGDQPSLPSFDRNTKMTIGAPVTENPGCKFSQHQWDMCRRNCSNSLVPLGAYRTYWKLGERQIGVQGGPSNFMFSLNQTSIKHDGRSIKSTLLDEAEKTDLLQFLGCSWGLQVSYCTGVARRIPLKALIVDLLPIFAKAENQESMLQDWIMQHRILQRLEEDDLQDLMHDLHNQDESMHQRLIWYIEAILNILKLTGIERGQNDLIIAWPHEKDLRRGVRIPCDKESYWVRILADSHLCATFAYITNKCLESNSTPCKGANRRWLGTTTILETAVSLYSVQEELTMRDLEHGKHYHMQTLDSLVVLKAEKDHEGVKLMVERSAVSRHIQKRIFVKRSMRTQIREKQAPEDRAEQVLVSAGDFLTELLGPDLTAKLTRR